MTGGYFGEGKKPALTVFDLLLSSTFESSVPARGAIVEHGNECSH